jgi:hypothetical protein
MIQRIQTVYLLLASLCLILTMFFGYASYSLGEDNVILFNLFGVTERAEAMELWFPYKIIVPLISALCIYSLTKYKKRQIQLFIGKMLYLLILLLLVFIFIDVFGIRSELEDSNDVVHVAYGAGLYLSVVALPLVFLANRAIKKDEKLVRDTDRLR